MRFLLFVEIRHASRLIHFCTFWLWRWSGVMWGSGENGIGTSFIWWVLAYQGWTFGWSWRFLLVSGRCCRSSIAILLGRRERRQVVSCEKGRWGFYRPVVWLWLRIYLSSSLWIELLSARVVLLWFPRHRPNLASALTSVLSATPITMCCTVVCHFPFPPPS